MTDSPKGMNVRHTDECASESIASEEAWRYLFSWPAPTIITTTTVRRTDRSVSSYCLERSVRDAANNFFKKKIPKIHHRRARSRLSKSRSTNNFIELTIRRNNEVFSLHSITLSSRVPDSGFVHDDFFFFAVSIARTRSPPPPRRGTWKMITFWQSLTARLT